jgi:hypothetical protein
VEEGLKRWVICLFGKKKKKKHLLSMQTDEGADLAEIQKLKDDI